jgi:hypothetical protein
VAYAPYCRGILVSNQGFLIYFDRFVIFSEAARFQLCDWGHANSIVRRERSGLPGSGGLSLGLGGVVWRILPKAGGLSRRL